MRLAAALLVFVAVVPAAAEEWTRLATPDFELYTTEDAAKGKESLRHFEQVREFFSKASPVRMPAGFPLRVIEFATAGQFAPYRINNFTTAYFLNTQARDYIVVGDAASGDYRRSIHEYMHLIVLHSGLRIPLWLNEGWADVYSTLRPMGKETAVGDLLPDRMSTLSSEPWMSFDELTSVNPGSSTYHEGNRVGIFYAESWALAHMLYLSPAYKDNFGKFVMALHNGKTAAEACQVAFGRSSAAVFSDLRAYFEKKRIYGQVFAARMGEVAGEAKISAVPPFDARLMLADLLVAAGKNEQARSEYEQLQKEQPNRPDLLQSMGNLALANKDLESARKSFEGSYAAGNADARMCFQLAVLEANAKQPPASIVPILERALKSKPDYTEARVQLGLTQIDARDFGGAVSTFMAIPQVTPELAPKVFCGLGFAYIQTGDAEAARRNAQDCRKWTNTDVDNARADALLKFIAARSEPSVGLRPGETVQRTTGIAKNVECLPEGNRLQVLVGSDVVTFDLPKPDAVEIDRISNNAFTFACGAQNPVRMGVEYAPPRSALRLSAGIVRRLVF